VIDRQCAVGTLWSFRLLPLVYMRNSGASESINGEAAPVGEISSGMPDPTSGLEELNHQTLDLGGAWALVTESALTPRPSLL